MRIRRRARYVFSRFGAISKPDETPLTVPNHLLQSRIIYRQTVTNRAFR